MRDARALVTCHGVLCLGERRLSGHEMPFNVTLKELPAGYALENASGVEESPARIVFREFTSSEDGELVISRLDGWRTTIFSLIPVESGLRVSEIDHLLAVVRQTEPRRSTSTSYRLWRRYVPVVL